MLAVVIVPCFSYHKACVKRRAMCPFNLSYKWRYWTTARCCTWKHASKMLISTNIFWGNIRIKTQKNNQTKWIFHCSLSLAMHIISGGYEVTPQIWKCLLFAIRACFITRETNKLITRETLCNRSVGLKSSSYFLNSVEIDRVGHSFARGEQFVTQSLH